MRKLAILLLVIAMFGGCKKEETKSECEINDTGTIQVANMRNNLYHVYIDNLYYQDINPKTTESFVVSTGTHTIKFVLFDYSAYYYKTLYVGQCDLENLLFDY